MRIIVIMNKVKVSTLLFIIAYGLYIVRAGIESTTFMAFFNHYNITRPITFIIGAFLIGTKVVLFDKKFDKKALCYIFLIAIIFLIEFYYTSYFDLLYLLLLMIGAKNIEIKNVVKTHFLVYLTITVLAAAASWVGIIENYITISATGAYRASWGNIYPTDFAAGLFYLLLDYVYLNYKKINIFRYLGIMFIVILSFSITRSQTSLILGILLLILLAISKNKSMICIFSSNIYKNTVACSFPIIAILTIYAQYIFKNNGYNNSFLLALNVIMNYRLGFGSRAIQQYGLSLFGRRIEFYGAGWGTNNPETYFYVDNAYLQYALSYGLLLTAFFVLGYFFLSKYIDRLDNHVVLIIILSCISLSAISEPRIFNILYNAFFLGLGILIWKYRMISTNKKVRRLFLRRR